MECRLQHIARYALQTDIESLTLSQYYPISHFYAVPVFTTTNNRKICPGRSAPPPRSPTC